MVIYICNIKDIRHKTTTYKSSDDIKRKYLFQRYLLEHM